MFYQYLSIRERPPGSNVEGLEDWKTPSPSNPILVQGRAVHGIGTNQAGSSWSLALSRSSLICTNPMHSITLNQNWKIVRVTLDPPQKGPSRKGKKPIQGNGERTEI